MKKNRHTSTSASDTALLITSVLTLGAVIVLVAFFLWEPIALALGPSVSFNRVATSTALVAVSPKPVVEHIATPNPVKAIYMSQCVVGTPSFRAKLVDMLDSTELNAVVIDIRDYTGKISFPTDDPVLKGMVSDACGALDMKSFIKILHDKHIYVIGRITTFQNPFYTKLHPDQAVQKKGGGVWTDHKGLAFVDVGAKPYWDTVVTLGKAAHDIGFDELNFDYVRFPSDGDMSAAVYSWDKGETKPQAVENFFKYLHDNLAPTGVVMSADLFGMVSTNADDLNIGQVLERAMPYFDFIDPMVYPSHYPTGFNGYKDVNAHPYNIVNFSLARAVQRATAATTNEGGLSFMRVGTTTPPVFEKPVYAASKIRPWLQSFNYPVVYTPEMVTAQIKATNDAGIQSYLFWDPANKYTALLAALKAHEAPVATSVH